MCVFLMKLLCFKLHFGNFCWEQPREDGKKTLRWGAVIEKFKMRIKKLKIEKMIAFDKYLHELFVAFYFHLSKNLLLTFKNNKVDDLTHFSTKCGCF